VALTSGFPSILSTSIPIGRPRKQLSVILNFPSEKLSLQYSQLSKFFDHVFLIVLLFTSVFLEGHSVCKVPKGHLGNQVPPVAAGSEGRCCFLQLLQDSSHLVRRKCLELIGALGSPDHTVAAGVGQSQPGTSTLSVLGDFSRDPDGRVRTQAFQSMVRGSSCWYL